MASAAVARGVRGGVFLTVELAIFAANLTKLTHGAWVPLASA